MGRIRISEKGGREGPSKDPTAPQSEHDAFIFESVFDQVSKPLEEKSDWFIKGAPRACMCEEGGSANRGKLVMTNIPSACAAGRL